MKPTPLLTLSLILFALLIGTGAALAQSRTSSPDEPPQAASPRSFEPLFLYLAEQQADETPWLQSNTVVDAAGGTHTTFFTNEYIYYATCRENCAELTQWTITPIAELDFYHAAAHPTLALNAAGQPRLMGFNGFYYVYAECNMDCNQPDSWSMVQLWLPMSIMVSYPTNGRYFALDSLGHPRFMAPHYSGTQYFFCDTNCTDLANWEFAILADDSRLHDIQLVFNNANQPRMLGIASNLEYNYMSLVYAQCDTNCEQSDNWHYVTLAPEVGASTRYPTYSLRLDVAGQPRIAFYKATGDEIIHYMWSNTDFTNLAS